MTPSDQSDLQFTPVIIIGAARSGTNALRDALVRLDQFATWPCDEINPIWRHGNVRHPDDALTSEHARPSVRQFIRRAFRRIWKQTGRPRFVVEKTCANTLRVGFVNAVVPEAYYVNIVRNGYDVVASAARRWKGELEVSGIPYLLSKARYAPVSDLPIYAWSFLKGRLRMLMGGREHVGIWGPRFPGIQDHREDPVEELCARQWVASVARADRDLDRLPPDRVLTVRYEEFAQDPTSTLSEIGRFLGYDADSDELREAAAPVRSGSIGKGAHLRRDLDPDIRELMRPPMQAHGYETE